MSIQIKVKGGTPESSKTLCLTCKYATIVRGQNMEELILCHEAFYGYGKTGAGPGIVPFKVAECTDYKQVNVPSKSEMEAIAWRITPRKRGQKGFQPSAEGEKTEMEVVIQPPKKQGSEALE